MRTTSPGKRLTGTPRWIALPSAGDLTTRTADRLATRPGGRADRRVLLDELARRGWLKPGVRALAQLAVDFLSQ